jgi:hypothetical protein
MIEALKPLLESGIVSPETREAINEAWQNQIKELQTSIRTEIREELSSRYAHDKATMIKTLDKMVSETLTSEIRQIKEEQIAVSKLKLQTLKEMKGSSKKFENFMTRALAEELAQFAQERKLQESHKAKLEKFVMSTLAEELNDFQSDRKAVIETRVKLVSEGKEQLSRLKKKFVDRSSKAVSKIVAETLNHEITQLHQDINAAKKNLFGRKIYEAFANEFTTNYLSENVEAKKLQEQVQELSEKLVKAHKIVESKNTEVKKLADRATRSTVISELLDPLATSKKSIMNQLLESVQTSQLRSAYNKYLPSVLNNKAAVSKPVLTESTGNKFQQTTEHDNSIDELAHLAGINKGEK